MFSVTFRVSKKQIAVAAATFVIAFGVGIWARAALSELRGDPAQTTAKKVWRADAKTNEQRVEFLTSFEWEIEQEADEIVDVKIPEEFDDVYENYNALQKRQGCDLKKYAGKRCKRYTYIVTNYPGKPENIRANLLVVNGKLVGGDICSIELEGFIHGFRKEADEIL